MYVLETTELNEILSDFGISPITNESFSVDNCELRFDDEYEGVEKW